MSKNRTYNEASARLEEIVAIIEHNNPDVDELTRLVEEAVELVAFCRNKLTGTDKQLETLMARLDESNGKSFVSGKSESDD
ncbi:exodeoxyribonuclease VII small subunit [Porphyromonas macacae]|uniref:Exodeoxyribonuclease VII small subunit n=1 Tax=Porphyromonas macacae TaxID=28115 RepID=A0A379DHJ5_9PORP|nr:exodeoxyribonuclease VII small subunit [Porphyromonas macacae]SUB77860.1 exodeoxyribonuclease VII small subunit [Porphyromonas macacae]